ncbi:MAG: hypothetical protein HYS27_22885 [Deltaproteobacteria bacterium]|nr:hypothetical protein [Deltaproteobacteria bacterium]
MTARVTIFTVVASFALSATAAKPAAKVDAPPEPPMVSSGHGPALRSIALDKRRAKGVYKVNGAPGLATVIELPEPWSVKPTCGDCVFGDAKPEAQLWRVDLFPDARTLSIKPTRLPGADLPSSAFVTNIDVMLDGGLAITLFVELSLPEQADARVEFTLPDDEKGATKLTKKERDLEARFDDRAKALANELMLAALMTGTTCKDFWGRPNRSRNVVVRLKQLCRNGTLTYVTFEVENRRRDDIFLTTATLEDTKQRGSAGEKLEKATLRFNERGLGIAGVAGAVDGAVSFKLTVIEEGVDGENNIVIEDITF